MITLTETSLHYDPRLTKHIFGFHVFSFQVSQKRNAAVNTVVRSFFYYALERNIYPQTFTSQINESMEHLYRFRMNACGWAHLETWLDEVATLNLCLIPSQQATIFAFIQD